MNDSREVVEIVHTKKVRYYRLFIIYCNVLWISIIQSEAILIKKYDTLLSIVVSKRKVIKMRSKIWVR